MVQSGEFEEETMAQNISKTRQEQQAARLERQELKAELGAQAANRPRRPVNR